MLKYLYEALLTAKKSTKTGKNFREGGGKNFSGWPEYIPQRFNERHITSFTLHFC